MKFLFAFIFFSIAMLISAFSGSREWQFAFISVATIVGFLFGQVRGLSKELTQLRQSLAKDWESRNSIQPNEQSIANSQENSLAKNQTESESKSNAGPNSQDFLNTENLTNTSSDQQEDYMDAINQASDSVQTDQPTQAAASNWASSWDKTDSIISDDLANANSNNNNDQSIDANLAAKSNQPSIADIVIDKVKSYFLGGNIFVRVGIVILFFGVSFLLKYVSDRGFFPVEYRLIGVVVGAMFLLGLGWRLRHKNEIYALLLQGAGIGVLYLDIFAAYNLYQLIPPFASFALLFVVSMFSAALAVMQNSKSLAVLGFSGGFLAPILASTGSNNHVGLFSYYAILNIAIVVIAWFKAWRELNLLGFAFTFIIGTVWGVLSYNSAKFASTEPFLILFFVFYVLIAVLYALRQPPKLKGYVDGSLLFGVPVAASALQYYLVKDYEFGVSISSFAMGAFYMMLSWFIWKRKGDDLKLLAEAFLALGVIFASMAIPFALAPTQTAATWALEGAGFIWLGSRQNRLSVRSFGVLLQIAAGVIFLVRYDYVPNTTAFLNAEFISSMMLAIGGLLSARLLIKPFAGKKPWEDFLSSSLLIWGLIWLIGGFSLQLFKYFNDATIPSVFLIFIAAVSLMLGLIATRVKPIWKQALIAAFVLFLLILFGGFIQFVFAIFSYANSYHPSVSYGWLAWPVVFGVYYFLQFKLDKHLLFPRFQTLFHTVLLLLGLVLITYEGAWWIFEKLGIESAWLAIWFAIPVTVTMWLIIKAKAWPFSSHKEGFRRYSGSILAVLLAFWSFAALIDKGVSDPLPWIPVLNPLDIMVLIIFITLFKWWQSTNGFKFTQENISDSIAVNTSNKRMDFNKRLFVMGFALLAFLWLNFTLFRIAHHWFAIPWDDVAMYGSNLVQTAVSILWAFTGVLLTLFASRREKRLLWVIGAVLLSLVVLKLFIIDLSALGSLGRIISFLVVGGLLTSIGYFAPLPDKDDESVDINNNSADKNKDKSNENGDNKNA